MLSRRSLFIAFAFINAPLMSLPHVYKAKFEEGAHYAQEKKFKEAIACYLITAAQDEDLELKCSALLRLIFYSNYGYKEANAGLASAWNFFCDIVNQGEERVAPGVRVKAYAGLGSLSFQCGKSYDDTLRAQQYLEFCYSQLDQVDLFEKAFIHLFLCKVLIVVDDIKRMAYLLKQCPPHPEIMYAVETHKAVGMLLGSGCKQDMAKAIEVLETIIKDVPGTHFAMTAYWHLGRTYLEGRGGFNIDEWGLAGIPKNQDETIEVNIPKAIYCYECIINDPIAHNGMRAEAFRNLGQAYLQDLKNPASIRRALENYEAAIALGIQGFLELRQIDDMRFIAVDIYSGRGVPDSSEFGSDYKKAIAHLDYILAHSTDREDISRAQGVMGWLYLQGKGVPKNSEKALEYWNKAAQSTESLCFCHIAALCDLAAAYSMGQGAKKDFKKACYYYDLIVNPPQGCCISQPILRARLGACTILVDIYLQGGSSVKKDYARAKKYAELGLAIAQEGSRFLAPTPLFNQYLCHVQCRLGEMHYKGLGVACNIKKARSYFLNAINNSNFNDWFSNPESKALRAVLLKFFNNKLPLPTSDLK